MHRRLFPQRYNSPMRTFTAAFLFLLTLPLRAQDAPASDDALAEEKARVPVVREAILRTVLVETAMGELTMPLGSGAVVSAEGHVVTCAHVVEAVSILGQKEGAFRVVLSDGKRYEAKLLGRNSANDIALLKIEAEKLPHFDLARDRRPARGEGVIALGFPAGNIGTSPRHGNEGAPNPSVALGRVTRPDKKFLVAATGGNKYYPDCIESDTPVFMGNSGGPLVNAKGELVGLNAAISMGGKTYTLSVGSIARCYDELKAGKDVPGERAEEGMDWDEYGKALLDMVGTSEPAAERPYLREPFAATAAARRRGVLVLWRGRERIGLATVLDGKGSLVATTRAVDRRGFFDKVAEKVDKVAEESGLRDLWNNTKDFLGIGKPVEVALPSGRRVRATVGKRSDRFGLALLTIDPGNEELAPIPEADAATIEPGRWVAVLDGGDLPAAVGLLSTPKHSVDAVQRIPFSLSEWFDALRDGELRRKEFRDVILFDARLEPGQLGSPLCDARGRMIGIAIFHPSRGTTYAAPIGEVRKDLGLGK